MLPIKKKKQMMHFWAVLICFTWIGVLSLTKGQALKKQLHSKGLESRIINGHKATLGQFPWQAAIITKDVYGDDYMCGGSLINDQWILTAAHCFRNNRTVKSISLGTTYFYHLDYIQDDSRKVFTTATFYMHPEFDYPMKSNNDIALIKLPSPLKLNEIANIKPIWLADHEPSPGDIVIASGWGETHNGEESNDLLFAHMRIAPNETCWQMESKPSTICAVGTNHGTWTSNFLTKLSSPNHYNNENACDGDSGGPLVYYNKTTGKPFLVGVTSYYLSVPNKPYCKSYYPDFFTNVYKFGPWINNTIHNNTLYD